MGVFSDREIRLAMSHGQIVCHPLIDENIRGSSIDLTLGEHYYTCDSLAFPDAVYNPFDPKEVERYFTLKRAEPHNGALPGIPEGHPMILVHARSRILAHTHEFVGIHPPRVMETIAGPLDTPGGTSEMRARSSWGRNGIAVCLCAGWGDPGYINRWTMEIHNHNDEAVPLPVGERIAQLIFHRTGEVSGHYGSGGKYQTGEDIETVVANWKPSAMLPRSYNDERRLPLPILDLEQVT